MGTDPRSGVAEAPHGLTPHRDDVEPALTESYAFLLHYRISDPAWVSEGPAADHAEHFTAALRLRKLALLRRYTAKIRYELELNAQRADEPCRSLSDCYASELSEATGFRYRGESYLADTDPDFYSVEYFRAWCPASLTIP